MLLRMQCAEAFRSKYSRMFDCSFLHNLHTKQTYIFNTFVGTPRKNQKAKRCPSHVGSNVVWRRIFTLLWCWKIIIRSSTKLPWPLTSFKKFMPDVGTLKTECDIFLHTISYVQSFFVIDIANAKFANQVPFNIKNKKNCAKYWDSALSIDRMYKM